MRGKRYLGRTCQLSAVVAAFCLVGCQPKEPEANTAPVGPDPELARLMESEKNAPAEVTETTVAAADVVPPPPADVIAAKANSDIREVDFASFETELKTFGGKTVVIDCWATWCSICKQKFPKYLELRDEYASQPDLVFANLANDPVDKADSVKEFLTKSNAAMTCFLLDEDPADFASHFQVAGVPAYLIYSPDGELIFRAGDIEELAQKLAEMHPSKS